MYKQHKQKKKKRSEDTSDDFGSVAKDYNRAQAKKDWQAELEETLDEGTNGFGES